VICASLWFDPADAACPESFREVARDRMLTWGKHQRPLMSSESFEAFERANKDSSRYEDNAYLRGLLLDFISDFSNWDNSTNEHYLDTCRAITNAAHNANGGELGTRPLVVDPFAGGGAIPLEALRIGADSFASDLNPVAVLLNKIVLEYIPKYGDRLADEVQKWGMWVKEEAEKRLAEFYPSDPDGSPPIAYLWARTILCEGAGCGAEIPLLNQRLISKRRKVGVELSCEGLNILTNIRNDINPSDYGPGTVINGKVTCPRCGFSMPSDRYRQRSRDGHLGERIYCTVLSLGDGSRRYRNPTLADLAAYNSAKAKLAQLSREASGSTQASVVPDEPLSSTEPRRLNVLHYGFNTWGSLFNIRQQLTWTTLSGLLHEAFFGIAEGDGDRDLAAAVSTTLGIALSNLLQYNCNMSTWLSDGMISVFIQSSSIPMRADYAEANPMMDRLVGGLSYQLERTDETIRGFSDSLDSVGTAIQASATDQIFPNDSVKALITDPPYYFAIPYAELSDFFYVWLKRFLGPFHPEMMREDVTPKKLEAIQNLPHSQAIGQKDRQHFEDRIFEALEVGRREVGPTGIAIVVFAHASTEGWESLLTSLLRAGWVITASWPIDTEKESRMLASRQRALASSVHLVCRPRENSKGELTSEVGDWRDVLRELPVRIHEWMPRLESEGVVGADAIFACLGPALEIFSQYSTVEKPSGETVALREYLEHVWAAVAKEALTMIFSGADTAGFEEDARLTAMWLWTLFSGASNTEVPEETDDENDDERNGSKKTTSGYMLEYDAARKIAQGLGAHLEDLSSIIEVKGDKALLLPVSERARDLFGYESSTTGAVATGRKKKNKAQGKLFTEMEEEEYETVFGGGGAPSAASTTLDRVHQTMLLFGAGRSEAVKRFLVDDGVGNDERFWRLADNLSKLYPTGSEEKRWVDGVLARKKGLGF